MIRFFVLLLGMNISNCISYSQTNLTIQGRVLDESDSPLPGATIQLTPGGKFAISDIQGRFQFSGLNRGDYEIGVSFIGYQPVNDTIRLINNRNWKTRLFEATIGLQEVIVTDNYAEGRKKETSLNIETVNDTYLKQNMGGSLMKSLERLPGLSTIDIGSGNSKPVIRGLGFNRVVVTENNIKHEAQQWGADHGLEIDQYAVENIEVIKGPASIMYGSDAIGGVIELKNGKTPSENSYGGTIDISGKTNNNNLGSSISVYGRKNWFWAGIRGTVVNYGDYKVPTDSVDIYSYRAALYKNQLRNTAGREQNIHAVFGITTPRYQSRIRVSNIYNKSGFFANAHGLEPRNVDRQIHDRSSRDINDPYQTVSHLKITSSNHITGKKLNLDIDLGLQKNLRQEQSTYVNHGYMPAIFPDTLNFPSDMERQFEKYVYSGNLKISARDSGRLTWVLGINSDYQDNRINGRGFIIPAYKQLNIGGFGYGKYKFSEKSQMQTGIRFDYGKIKTSPYYDWFPSPRDENNPDSEMEYLQRAMAINRDYSSITWSVGYNYTPGKWLVKVNAGKSFRMPIAKELAANGVNYHHYSYEIGNSSLSPEKSWQFDLGVEYNSKIISVAITPFFNYFSNYIYLNPTSQHDRLYGNGNQVFKYTQSKVGRIGTEFHSHYQLIKTVTLGLTGEYFYSEQLSGEKKGFGLPFSPPASILISLKYTRPRAGFIETPYISADYKITSSQKHIVPPEETTQGYQVINIRLGGEILLQRQKMDITLQIQNLFNSRYFNHTSYYRLINVPEPGRNVILNITIPFSGNF